LRVGPDPHAARAAHRPRRGPDGPGIADRDEPGRCESRESCRGDGSRAGRPDALLRRRPNVELTPGRRARGPKRSFLPLGDRGSTCDTAGNSRGLGIGGIPEPDRVPRPIPTPSYVRDELKQAEEASFVDLIACERDCRSCSYAAALDCDGNCGVCPHNGYCPCVNPVVARSKTALRLIELRPLLLQDLQARN